MRRWSCLSSPPLITGELPSLTWMLCWLTSTCCSETSLTHLLTPDQPLQPSPPLILPDAFPRNIFLYRKVTKIRVWFSHEQSHWNKVCRDWSWFSLNPLCVHSPDPVILKSQRPTDLRGPCK